MKTLIAVWSFEDDCPNHQIIRETWGSQVSSAGADLLFFVGRRGSHFSSKRDEIPIAWQQPRLCGHPWWDPKEGCCEDYFQFETRRVFEWALSKNYDYVFLAENDTFLLPKKLMKTGFENYDCSGYFFQGDEKYPIPHAGYGHFISAKAMRLVLDTPPNWLTTGFYIGYALGPHVEAGNITLYDIPNFKDQISWHYVESNNGTRYRVGGVNSKWLREMFKAHAQS